jgi:hypothetical protein
MTLPADTARCAGIGSDADGWREGCLGCLRRAATGEPMEPPTIIVFRCEFHIPGRFPNTGDMFGDKP